MAHLQKTHHFVRPDYVNATLYVITPLFNPVRFRSRWRLYKQFEKYVLDSGQIHLVTIECVLGNRETTIEQQPDRHTVIRVRTNSEIWIKENLLNIAISRLPSDWQYVAWIDADLMFARPDWVGETLQQLQHYHVVQMFSQAIDLTPGFEHLNTQYGFMWSYLNPDKVPPIQPKYYTIGANMKKFWHPGYAWAARREAIDALGGLIEWSILGSADTLMAYALIGAVTPKNKPNYVNSTMLRYLMEWQARAEHYIRRNVGFVEGVVLHYWHGKKIQRGYNQRGAILSETRFDPEKDLKKDWQGLWQLTERNPSLRDRIRGYFRSRNEDSIDVD